MIEDGEVNTHLGNPGYNRGGGARNSANSGSGVVGT